MRILKLLSVLLLIALLLYSCSDKPRRIQPIKKDLSGYVIKTDRGNCTVNTDIIDPLTGYRKTDMKPVRVFTFTHEKLKPHYKDNPFLTCDGYLSRVQDDKFLLHLNFLLSTKNQMQFNYKGLSQNSVLRITLINGEQLFVANAIDSPGNVINSDLVNYSAIYPLSSSDLKSLRKFEIGYFGVMWKGGYETYSVHDLDFLMRQLECFSYF